MPNKSQRAAVRAFSQKAIQAPNASGRRAAASGRYTEAARRSATTTIKQAQAARKKK